MSTMLENPLFIIATLLHEQGPTGVQAHFNAFKEYLPTNGFVTRIITPFDAQRVLVYTVFGARYIIGRIHDEASVWWYRQWFFVFLKQILRKLLRNGQPAVIYAQCPLSAKAAMEVRKLVLLCVFSVSFSLLSQAQEWAENGKIELNGELFRS